MKLSKSNLVLQTSKVISICILLLSLFAQAGGKITQPFIMSSLMTGWNSDTFSILKNDAQYFNPANCPLKDQYAAISSTP